MKYVYLAGPILGCTQSEANDWRHYVNDRLRYTGIVSISPLRREPIVGPVYEAGYDDPKFGSAAAIGSKNFYDTEACDFVLVYLPRGDPAKDKEVSLGTLIELGWARKAHKPIILVTDNPFVAGHPVVRFCANWTLGTLDDAIDVLVGVLGGYTGGKNV